MMYVPAEKNGSIYYPPDCICLSTVSLFTDDCLLYETVKSPRDAIDLQTGPTCHVDVGRYLVYAA